jgi:SAM-dependent methyltransferase
MNMSNQPSTTQQLEQMIVGSWITQAVYIAAELGLADLLAEGSRNLEDLARQTATQREPLYRVLRALVSVGIFAEDGRNRFSLTPVAEPLRSDVPDSRRAFAILAGAEFYGAWGQLLNSVQNGTPAFERVFGAPFFDYMFNHPKRGQIYNAAMEQIHGAETEPVLDAYSFAAFSTVVDVGGGNGTQLAALLQRHPGTRGILFDLPAVAERAQTVLSGLDLSERCRIMAGDFFGSVPVGGDAYVLRHIIHDWDDERAATILRNCREAMNPGGRVVVVETVISAGDEPCFGKWLDLMMLVVGGRERTEEQYRRLFSSAGLRLSRIVPTAHEVSVVEGVRASP